MARQDVNRFAIKNQDDVFCAADIVAEERQELSSFTLHHMLATEEEISKGTWNPPVLDLKTWFAGGGPDTAVEQVSTSAAKHLYGEETDESEGPQVDADSEEQAEDD